MTLTLDDVTLRLGDGDDEITALDRVSLTVAAGELIAVVGPSGSGKSSLLAVAGALLRPTSGRVRIGTEDITDASDRDRTAVRARSIGFVFQGSNLLPSLTALEQLQLIPDLAGQRPSAARARATELLTEVGMAERLGRRPGRLSGGERQRVGIARALMNDPSIILADEPTSALDTERSHEIVRLLARETHTRQVATVMVTHDTTVLDLVDRIYTMADGRLTVGLTSASRPTETSLLAPG